MGESGARAPNLNTADDRPDRAPLRRVDFLLIFAFWTFIALLMAANGMLDPRGRGLQPLFPSAPIALAFAQSYLWAILTPVIFWLSSRLSIERSNWFVRVLLVVGVGIVVAMVVEGVASYLRFYVLFTPLRIPRGGLQPFNPLFGVTRLFWLPELIVYLALLAAGFARIYFLRYRGRLEETARLQAHAAQLQAQLAEARLAVLRTQLNPHFLFNTLHAVSALVERDPKGVRRMIARLSDLLRYTLDGTTAQEITLREELELLQRYLEILQIRFQGHLETSVDASPDVQEALVPNLILQPLVENAMKHGVSSMTGMGRIEVAARRSGDDLVLTVRDNGRGPNGASAPLFRDEETPTSDGTSGGVGLRNTRSRLEQLYGTHQRFMLTPAAGGGMIAEVVLPFHTRADLRAAAIPVASA